MRRLRARPCVNCGAPSPSLEAPEEGASVAPLVSRCKRYARESFARRVMPAEAMAAHARAWVTGDPGLAGIALDACFASLWPKSVPAQDFSGGAVVKDSPRDPLGRVQINMM